jgi:peptidoglycan-associated lipoprotein
MQKLLTLLKIFLLGISILLLVACSTLKHHTSATNLSVGNEVSTRGIGSTTEFDDTDVNANKLLAPYDQVYYFDFDKYDVHQEDIASIRVQSDYLIAHPNARIRIEGNTDERGSREYNITLGWRRAKAVAAVIKQEGVSPKQIVTLSYGKEKPVAFGHDEDSYRLNRRVNLVYEVK